MINPFIEAIKNEQKRIQRFIDLSRSENPDGGGSLQLKSRGKHVYAYLRWQKNGHLQRKIYLGTLESAAVREHFSEKFTARRLVRLRHDQTLLETLAQQYQAYDFASIAADMPQAYRVIAKSNPNYDVFHQRYEQLREWASADYPKNTLPFPDAKIYAEDGTRLRSKGECIFYNLMQGRGILFRNDCRIEITDKSGRRKIFCPDFLIQCFDGTFIIIEHLGGMDSYGYAMDFGEKSYWYFQEGFILGKNFFVTSDDLHHGTDSQMIALVVDRIEEMFFGF